MKKENEMEDKEKLIKQLFIGKVFEILGHDKTLQLLRESRDTFNKLENEEFPFLDNVFGINPDNLIEDK